MIIGVERGIPLAVAMALCSNYPKVGWYIAFNLTSRCLSYYLSKLSHNTYSSMPSLYIESDEI
jgi:hypothetical protein